MAYETFARDIIDGWDLRLRKYVSHRRLTYKDLMKVLEVSRGTATNLLSGRHKPSRNVAEKMAIAFTDLDINWLLFGLGNQPNYANMVTPKVTPSFYESSVTNYSTTHISPPPPSDNAYQHIDIAKLMQIIDNQGKTIDNQGQTINQLIEQNKMLTELIKLGKFNAVTFTCPQEYPIFTNNNSSLVTLAVTALRNYA